MWPQSKACLPAVRELRYQPCTRRLAEGGSLDFKLQATYPSPPMSRRSSINDHVSQVEHTSAPTSTAVSVNAPPPTSTSAAAAALQPPRNLMQQIHPVSPRQDLYLERRHSVQSHSVPAAFSTIDYQATHPLTRNVQPYVSTSFQLSRATRKSKQHVQSACVNCKQAHLSCDDHRPCQRCVRRNLDSTCLDVPHRKRGRPRIREQIPNEAAPFPLDRRRRPSTAVPAMRGAEANQTTAPLSTESAVRTADAFGHPYPAREPEPITPVAFLDTDFRIVRTNRSFRDVFRFVNELHGQPLERLVDTTSEESLEALRNIRTNQLHERDEKNPSYLPPIRKAEDPENGEIPQVDSCDLWSVSRGYTTTRQTLQLLSTEGRSIATTVDLCLARTAVIFVVLKIPFLQSPQRPLTSHKTATSIASSGSTNLDTRRSSYTVASQPLDGHRSTNSTNSSPSKPFEWIPQSLPPTISPISPVSRQPYPPIPDFSSSTAKSQSTQALDSSPFDSFTRTETARLGPQFGFSAPGRQTRQTMTASNYPLPPTSSTQNIPAQTQADTFKLPPITTLGATSTSHHSTAQSAITDVGTDQSRLERSREQQTRQRAADRVHREESLGEAPARGSEQSPKESDGGRETRKRKRGLDVSDLTR